MTTHRWNIDSAHSSINFAVRHMVFAKVRGRFAAYAGTLDLDEGDLAQSQIDVTIDAASIDTGTAQRDDHLRSADFFDVAKFAQLGFRSTRIDEVESGRYRVTGDLTIRDVTRPLTLEVEATGKGKDPWGNERLGFAARASIDRKDFGLTWNQLLEAGGVLVGERVEIELDVQAVKAAAAKAA